MLTIKRIQILLLALSSEQDVRDSKLAKNMAEQMYNLARYPVNLELLALANASSGDFELAVQQLRLAITDEQSYTKSRNLERMQDNLMLLQKRQLPGLQWQQEITHMLPPPTNALASFRDYPDPNPI